MRRFIFIAYCLLTGWLATYGQGENNIWAFTYGPGGNNLFISFNTGIPILTATPNYLLAQSCAVCYPNGQLRFFVRLSNNTNSSFSNNIFLPNGAEIQGTDLGTGILTDGCMPLVIPRPLHPDQYYIFYSFSNGLRYSLLDMSLNNGNGGILTGQKDVTIAPYGTIVGQKMTAIKGCNGVWLVIRVRSANQYYSFHVTSNGLDTNKVISEAGNFSLYDYNQTAFGQIKASPEGSKLAFCGWAGVELYDFEKCSGKVKNARMLDATGNAPLGPENVANHTRYNGIGFSPDGSKLYVTFNQKDSTFIPSQNVTGGFVTAEGTGLLKAGKLYQFDLSQSTTAGIIASKTLIFSNQPSIMENGGVCNLVVQNPLGEIKNGPDAKLYVDNGSYTCWSPANIPNGYNPGAGFHVINQPNLPGLACLPQLNAIVVNNYFSAPGSSFYASSDGGKSYLQQDIVTAPPPPDTTGGQIFYPHACFADSLVLTADTNGSCYRWDDGSTEKIRTVFHSGFYYVSYFKNCNYTTDTFRVEIVGLPVLTIEAPSCPGMYMGKIRVVDSSGSNTRLSYIWRTSDSSILRQSSGLFGDSIMGLDTGHYSLEIISPSGCDTILSAIITALPKPEIMASPTDTVIHYGDSLILRATGALLYTWLPSGIMDTSTKQDPIAKPLQPTLISVIGMNEYGCEDTAYVRVDIDYTMPSFIPNAFSPNGDGLNDNFHISGITYQKVIAFRIYNRFGQEIFSTFDGQQGWNGMQYGKPCDIGTYYYFIQLDYPDGSRKTFKGDVTLLR
jgi:gliding motility-associated-like protein